MNDYSWDENYATTASLNVRLDLVRQCVASGDAFGLEYLDRGHVDGKSVLNVGCGTGIHDKEFLSRTGARPRRYVLSDKSAAMATDAAANLRPHVPHVESLTLAVDELSPASLGSFDLIICMHMLYHVPEPARAIMSLARLLAKDGKLLITTVSHANNCQLLAVHNHALHDRFGLEKVAPTCWRFDTSNAVDMVGSTFRDIQAHYRLADLKLETVADALSYYRSMAYYKDAVRCGVSSADLLDAVAAGVGDVIGRQGHFSCNKNTVTLIASAPRAPSA